jgi:hypothetical protein
VLVANRRSLHAKISLSESVESMSEWAQLLWDRVIVHADDYGVLEASPAKLKGRLKPLSPRPPADFAAALAEMAAVQMLVIYTAKHRIWAQIANFEEHQEGLHKRGSNKNPLCCDGEQLLPDEYIDAVSGKIPEVPGISGLVRAGGNETKRNETKGNETEPSASADAAVSFDAKAWFARAWEAYPLKRGKHDAQRHFVAQVKSEERAQHVLRAIENYKAECAALNRPYQHGETWFNHRWEDFVDGVWEMAPPRISIAKSPEQASLIGAHVVQSDATNVYAALAVFESEHGSRPSQQRPEARAQWDAAFVGQMGFHPDELLEAQDDDFARWARTIRRTA